MKLKREEWKGKSSRSSTCLSRSIKRKIMPLLKDSTPRSLLTFSKLLRINRIRMGNQLSVSKSQKIIYSPTLKMELSSQMEATEVLGA